MGEDMARSFTQPGVTWASAALLQRCRPLLSDSAQHPAVGCCRQTCRHFRCALTLTYWRAGAANNPPE